MGERLGAQRKPPAAAPQKISPPGPDVRQSIPSLGRDALYETLGSSPRGLPASEARARLARVGPNTLPPPRRRSVAAELAAQLTNMFAVVLVVASLITFLTYVLSTPRDTANLELAIGILGVVVLNAFIGFGQEHAAERTAEALQAMLPATARVVRDGELDEIPVAELVPGDLMVLNAGDAISADGRLIESNDLAIEMSALTGESLPTPRISEVVSPEVPPSDARNCIFMGTSVTKGSGRALVYATGLDSEFGRIYKVTAEIPQDESPLQHQVTSMAKRVAAVAIGAGAALFALRSVVSHSLVGSFVFALGVMVALVPEGLPATLSVSLAVAVRRMARRHVLIRKLTAVEALGSTTVICTDKTGTLTKAEMTVELVWESGRGHAVTGVGYGPEGEVADPASAAHILRAGALCSDARVLPPDPARRVSWRVLGDTTEGAILVAALKAGVVPANEENSAPRVGTFPFDADRKLMTTVHRAGGAFVCYTKGSPQAVIERCTRVNWEGRERPLDAETASAIRLANDEMASRGLRVLAVAERQVGEAHLSAQEAERDLVFLGLVAMSDPPRPEVTEAVTACRRASIRIYMITGDYGLTAEAIARRVGIVGDGPLTVVNGSDLDTMEDARLEAMLASKEQLLFARARPEHKMRLVGLLQSLGETVAVTGDGVNDAPALKRASIGIAMGEGGTDVARAASVMILLDDSFASIAVAVEAGRAVYQNIRKFLAYLFSHNLAELAPILVAVFVGFPLVALSALQVLAIDLGSDVMPALALGTEGPEPGIMSRPPRPAGEHLFNWPLVRRFLFLGGIQSAGVVFAFFWRIHSAHIPYDAFTASNPTYREALTMTQAGIVVSQFFNSFAVRTDTRSLRQVGIFSNKPLVAAGFIGLTLISCVSYVPALQSVFNTAPLKVSDWLMLVGFGAFLLAADEARKALHRRGERKRVAGQVDDSSGEGSCR